MKKIKLLLLMLTVVILACKDTPKNTETTVKTEDAADNISTEKKISITLSPKSNSNVEGSIHFIESNGIVTMDGTVSGLEEGKHAIHIHKKADCSADDGTSSGGHWNPTGQPHGAWGDKAGYHKGDIGNLTANAKGIATINKSTNEWCIGCGDKTKDILGKAVIVHIGIDDLETQPTGAAGARIGCAGIIE